MLNNIFKLLTIGYLTQCAAEAVVNEKIVKDLNTIDLLNELPIEKLLRLKNSLKELTEESYFNTSLSEPVTFEDRIALPLKRFDHDVDKKEHHSKISSLFSLSVTTLAFLAFGGYLLCLIVQSLKYKMNYQPAQSPTFFVSSGIKQKPQGLIASYGRKKRALDEGSREREGSDLTDLGPSPDEMFDGFVKLCEGYTKWHDASGIKMF